MTSSRSSIRRRRARTSTPTCRATTSRSSRRSTRRSLVPTRPDALLIGIAPTGGRLPDAWRAIILAAIAAGLDVLSGLHTFLGDDPEFARRGRARGRAIVDYRRPPDRMETAVGRRHAPGKRVILTVGSDCAIGKMSVALELRRAALAAGDKASFVPTGQTGMMIEGWGVAVDRLISDFAQGTIEWLVEQGEALGDWVIVEGQGSLDHPAYSSVTLALSTARRPQAMVMVHKPGLAEHDFDHLPEASFPIARLPGFIALHEQVAGLVAPSKVVAVALNTSLYPDEDEARAIIAATAAETGLPTDDPFRFGADRLWAAIRESVDALPWVADADEPAPDPRDPPPRPARPVPDRPDRPRRGRSARHDGRRRAPRRPLARASSEWGRAIRTGSTARRRRRWRSSSRSCSRRSARSRADDAGPGRGGSRAWRRPSAATARRAARSTSPCTTSSARSTGRPVHELRGLSADIPPTDFTIGIDEPDVVAERAARAADFPALKIKCGGPEDLATLRGGARRLRRTDPGRRQHGLGARGGGPPPARARTARRRADRAAVPGRPARPARLAPGTLAAADRGRRELRAAGGPRPPRRRRGRGQRQARQVRRHRAGQADARTRAATLGFKTFLGCMEETSVGIAGSAVVASLADWVDLDGCLLLADDPFEGLDLDADHRWMLTRRDPGLGLTRPAVLTGPRTDRTGVHMNVRSCG